MRCVWCPLTAAFLLGKARGLRRSIPLILSRRQLPPTRAWHAEAHVKGNGGLLDGEVTPSWAACSGWAVSDRLGTTWWGKGSCRNPRPPFLRM